ncbi:MAG: rhomboid family intramembrane serine protease, partial [Desulfobulbaceae bacterium]|nr:rhomboid family intramembrane serine protease [Desulfobulbaceae bacterium]
MAVALGLKPPSLDTGQGEVIAVAVAQGEKDSMELFSLVLLSVNISHRLLRSDHLWRVEVSPSELVAARDHLARFEEENRGWPPLPAPVPFNPGQGWALTALLAGLALFHGITGPWRADNPWFVRGAVDSDLVFAGSELWRVVTGLTLHADASHLLGNVILGGVVLSYLSSQIGGGGVWLLALMTGGLGNYLNALYH